MQQWRSPDLVSPERQCFRSINSTLDTLSATRVDVNQCSFTVAAYNAVAAYISIDQSADKLGDNVAFVTTNTEFTATSTMGNNPLSILHTTTISCATSFIFSGFTATITSTGDASFFHFSTGSSVSKASFTLNGTSAVSLTCSDKAALLRASDTNLGFTAAVSIHVEDASYMTQSTGSPELSVILLESSTTCSDATITFSAPFAMTQTANVGDAHFFLIQASSVQKCTFQATDLSTVSLKGQGSVDFVHAVSSTFGADAIISGANLNVTLGTFSGTHNYAFARFDSVTSTTGKHRAFTNTGVAFPNDSSSQAILALSGSGTFAGDIDFGNLYAASVKNICTMGGTM